MDKNKKIILGVVIALIAILTLLGVASNNSDTGSLSTSSGSSNHNIGNDSQNDIIKEEFNSDPSITYTLAANLDYDYVEDHFVKENMEIKKSNPEFAGSTIGTGIETKDYYTFALMIDGKYSADMIYEKSTGTVKTITG
jgi:hypothetical protein